MTDQDLNSAKSDVHDVGTDGELERKPRTLDEEIAELAERYPALGSLLSRLAKWGR